MKTIIKIIIALLLICSAVYYFTGRTASEIASEKVVEQNKKAKNGESIKCPNCWAEFEKTSKHPVFCTKECEKSYYAKVGKAAEVETKAVDAAKDVGNKAIELVKSAVGKE